MFWLCPPLDIPWLPGMGSWAMPLNTSWNVGPHSVPLYFLSWGGGSQMTVNHEGSLGQQVGSVSSNRTQAGCHDRAEGHHIH